AAMRKPWTTRLRLERMWRASSPDLAMAIPAFSTSSGGGRRMGLNSRNRWALVRLAAYHKAKKIKIEAVRRTTTTTRLTGRSAEPRRFRVTPGAVSTSPVETADTIVSTGDGRAGDRSRRETLAP